MPIGKVAVGERVGTGVEVAVGAAIAVSVGMGVEVSIGLEGGVSADVVGVGAGTGAIGVVLIPTTPLISS